MAKTGTGTKSSCYEDVKEEEYIDMDITTSAAFIYYKKSSSSSPPHTTREFEFHNSSTPLEKEPIASPADELFYKGKLLPLHLPPRIQMVERLLQAPKISSSYLNSTSPLCNTTNTTPFTSCTASPATSCYVSGELNADDYFFDCSTGMTGNEAGAKKSWSKKLKFIRQLNLGNKLKAPKAYLKSIFTNGSNKSAVSDDRYTSTKNKEYSNGNGYLKAWKKNPFGAQIRRERCIASGTNYNDHPAKFGPGEEGRSGHRRSFSSAIIRNSLNKSSFSSVSSSCSSSNCSSFSCASSAAEPVLKRSSSANSEMENPIQGAIAYCKKSQQLASVRKSMSDTGFCFVTGIKIAADCEELEEEDMCIV